MIVAFNRIRFILASSALSPSFHSRRRDLNIALLLKRDSITKKDALSTTPVGAGTMSASQQLSPNVVP